MWQFVSSLIISDIETQITNAEIPTLFQKGVDVHTVRKKNDHDSRIFTRTKKDGNYRMSLNLKRFDEFFKFERI